MTNIDFETLSDVELDLAAGGADGDIGFSLTLGEGATILAGPLGAISLNPLELIANTVGGLLEGTGAVLTAGGGALTDFGKLVAVG